MVFLRKLSLAGVAIAVVQIVNASKKILSILGLSSGMSDFIVNIVFDLLPFGVIIIYWLFYRIIDRYLRVN